MSGQSPTKKDWTDDAARLLKLFESNQRSVGRFTPADGKVFTEYRAPNVTDWVDHLEGTRGVGCVPILDDNTCAWAALDIDNHDADEDLPIAAVDEKVCASKLPLVLCRSKSGGIHAYAFFSTPQPASRVRVVMARWSELLGYGGCEVFPKQSVLMAGSNGNRSLGNWINMPYMSAPDTIRYGFRDGKKLTLAQFLDLSDRLKCTEAHLADSILFDHPQAPPCVQKMMSKGVSSGQRNESLFNVTIYLRKAFPEDFKEKARDINSAIFDKPLPRSEMLRTVASASRPDYSYRCNEEPLRSLCDRQACLKRKYGISKPEYDALEAAQALPMFSDLVRYSSEPVRWGLSIDGTRIENLHTEELLSWQKVRQAAVERLMRVLPVIKNGEWERMLQPLLQQVRVMETPDDASLSGVMREKLREFARKADLSSDGENIEERKNMLRGLPCVQVHQGERAVVFRGQDFLAFLKRNKAELLKGVDLWMAIRSLGVHHAKMRAGENNINVWVVPIKGVLEESKPEAPKFETRL